MNIDELTNQEEEKIKHDQEKRDRERDLPPHSPELVDPYWDQRRRRDLTLSRIPANASADPPKLKEVIVVDEASGQVGYLQIFEDTRNGALIYRPINNTKLKPDAHLGAVEG